MPASRALRFEFDRLGLDHTRAYSAAEIHAHTLAHAAKQHVTAAPATVEVVTPVLSPVEQHADADVPLVEAEAEAKADEQVPADTAPPSVEEKQPEAEEVVVVASSKKGRFGKAPKAAPEAPVTPPETAAKPD